MLIIGAGVWGQKVNKVLTESGTKTVLIGAREFMSSGINIRNTITESVELIWICTQPDLQIKIINTLTNSESTKIIIEKPISSDNLINNKLKEIFLKQRNLFISRPWNFSPIWINFKKEINATNKIEKLIVMHYGEVLRNHINPPQDWLHHDLCLILDLGFNFEDVEVVKNWSEDRQNLQIQFNQNMHFDISGGYRPNRKSSFIIENQSNTKFELDLNNGVFSILRSTGEEMVSKFQNSNSITIMVKYFQDLLINKKSYETEKDYLQILGLLSID